MLRAVIRIDVLRSVFWSLSVATAACGMSTPRVSAAPAAAPAAPSDAPLFAGELKDPADVPRAIQEHYTKYEYRIPMRDGARLFTSVYVPKDRTRTYPIMLERTPYSVVPYGVDNYPGDKNPRAAAKFAPSPLFIRSGYIFVHQDVRGRMMSEGTFVDIRPHRSGQSKSDIDESTDAWDTIDWLVKNVPANSGKVGVWGISYPGFYAAQAAVDAHPALKAVSPQAPVTEWFIGDDAHHNGAFCLADNLGFYADFGKPRPKPTPKSKWEWEPESGDVYDYYLKLGPLAGIGDNVLEGKIPFWNELMEHDTRDAYWKARDPRPFYRNVKPAVLTVGGLFDAEDLFGAFATYRAFEAASPGAQNTLVMGPWSHGGWARSEGAELGDVRFGAKTSLWYRESVEFPFFEHHLKGKSAAPLPEAWVFETGTNLWNAHSSWPPKGAKPVMLYFGPGGSLHASPPSPAPAAPKADLDGREGGADSWRSDPDKPVPYDESHSSRLEHDYMIRDQRFASRRPDVVTYSTGPLEGDLTLAGPIEADLWVTVTGTDADFVVKLVDVYPDSAEDPPANPSRGAVHLAGYQQLVRGDVMRGKFRNSFERPEPFKPNEPTRIHFAMPDVSHTFRSGHRIMVQVQSSWFPLIDRNPQTFVNIYRAKPSDFHAETHRILRTPDHPSALRITLTKGTLDF